LNPNSAADFRILRTELVIWRNRQLETVQKTAGHSMEAKIGIRINILSQERKLLSKINELQRDRASKHRKQAIDYILKKLTTPKKWRLKNGEEIELTTSIFTHEKQLANLYVILQNNNNGEDSKLLTNHVYFRFCLFFFDYDFSASSYIILFQIRIVSQFLILYLSIWTTVL